MTPFALRPILKGLRNWLLGLLSKSSVLSTLYYVLGRHAFSREHRAVLLGRAKYFERLAAPRGSSPLLRRNIHRLEKALIMQPRREVFGEGFIEETVDAFLSAEASADFCQDELSWARDVLSDYFSVVTHTPSIARVATRFEETQNGSVSELGAKVPYAFEALKSPELSFETLHTLFLHRRSVRWYRQVPVPDSAIQRAVAAAALAPSACNRLPYRVYASSDQAHAVAMASLAGGTPGWAENIPCCLAIVGDLSAYAEERDRHLIYIDGALASMQLMLALDVQGIASCPINWPDVPKAEARMASLLNLEPYDRPVMLISVGYGLPEGGVPYSQKKSASALLRWVGPAPDKRTAPW